MKSYNYETHETREMESWSGKISRSLANRDLPPPLSRGEEDAVNDVRRWTAQYRAALSDFRDADGVRPRHTFFYPAEDYDSKCIELLAGFCREGWGEVEVQLHHRNDTADGFCDKIELFKSQLAKHGLLGMDQSGIRRFGFVHGNWSLCNSRSDGDWCGVNEELGLLQKLGCFADFTFPSAPSDTQPRMVNCIYRAVDAPEGRGCDRGRRSEVGNQVTDGEEFKDETHPSLRGAMEGSAGNLSSKGGSALGGKPERESGRSGGGKPEDGKREDVVESRSSLIAPLQVSGFRSQVSDDPGLMLITGPLGVRWDGLRPRLENGALTAANPPTPSRVNYWVNRGISVIGRPDWIFVKVHMHGLNESDALISDGMRSMHGYLQEHCNDGREWCLHYTSAREMYNIARAAEAGKSGNPGDWRDYEVLQPNNIGSEY